MHSIIFAVLAAATASNAQMGISPGGVAQHNHRVLGASGFGSTYDPVAIRKSTCTTVPAQADKSAYWHPNLYKVNYDPVTKKQTYSPMWAQTRIYYNFPQLIGGTGPGSYVEPFPDNFQMIAGNPSKKTGGGYSQEDLSVFYYCEKKQPDGTDTGYQTFSLPTEGCSTIMTKIWFPSCWDGQTNFDGKLSSQHVKYPDIGGGLAGANCPAGFEHRLPIILIESFHIQAGEFPDGPAGKWGSNGPNVPTYILSNGDTTGFGLHADFANGWDTNVLSQVVKQCTTTDFSLSPEVACPPLAPLWNPAKALACHLDGGIQVPAEQTGWQAPLDALPGCNLPWGATGPKPTCDGFRERKLAPWTTLVGVEQNEEVSAADLANPFASAVAPATTATASNVAAVATSSPIEIVAFDAASDPTTSATRITSSGGGEQLLAPSTGKAAALSSTNGSPKLIFQPQPQRTTSTKKAGSFFGFVATPETSTKSPQRNVFGPAGLATSRKPTSSSPLVFAAQTQPVGPRIFKAYPGML